MSNNHTPSFVRLECFQNVFCWSYLIYHNRLSDSDLTVAFIKCENRDTGCHKFTGLAVFDQNDCFGREQKQHVYITLKRHICTVADKILHSSSASTLHRLPSDLLRFDLGLERFEMVSG